MRTPPVLSPFSDLPYDALLRTAAVAVLALALNADGQTLLLEKATIDAGTVKKGAVAKGDFVIRNTGNAELRILDVRPKCACMTATFDKRITPGSEGRISVAVDTKTFQGPISKMAEILSNDPAAPSTSITLIANVRAFVTASPHGFVRLQAEAGTAATQQLTLSSDVPTFRPSNIKTPKPYLTASLTPGATASEWILTVTCDANAPLGLLGGSITLQTGVPEQPELSLAVSGYVKPKGADKNSAPAVAASAGPKLTNADVIEMVTGGLSDEVVVTAIKQAGAAAFDISPTGLLALKKSKVSDAVIVAMQNKAPETQSAPRPPSQPVPQVQATPCAGLEMMGLYKVDMRPMSPLIVYQAKVRNRTSVTQIVTIGWLDMYGAENEVRGQIGPGDIGTFNLAPQEPRDRQPQNLRVKSCE